MHKDTWISWQKATPHSKIWKTRQMSIELAKRKHQFHQVPHLNARCHFGSELQPSTLNRIQPESTWITVKYTVIIEKYRNANATNPSVSWYCHNSIESLFFTWQKTHVESRACSLWGLGLDVESTLRSEPFSVLFLLLFSRVFFCKKIFVFLARFLSNFSRSPLSTTFLIAVDVFFFFFTTGFQESACFNKAWKWKAKWRGRTTMHWVLSHGPRATNRVERWSQWHVLQDLSLFGETSVLLLNAAILDLSNFRR